MQAPTSYRLASWLITAVTNLFFITPSACLMCSLLRTNGVSITSGHTSYVFMSAALSEEGLICRSPVATNTIVLRMCQGQSEGHESSCVCVPNFLKSLPSVTAPLRHLSLQHGILFDQTPFTGAAQGCGVSLHMARWPTWPGRHFHRTATACSAALCRASSYALAMCTM